MKARVVVAVMLACFICAMAAAQNAIPTPGIAGRGSQPEKKEKKKQAEKSFQQDESAGATEFTLTDANQVLNDFRDGLEGHSSRLFMSAFEREKMDGYLSFEDQVQAFFQQYETFRVHIRILQTAKDGARGVMLAEFELEGTPRGGGPALRRSGQLRFELERGQKGWKVVALRPRGFFA